VRRTVRAMRLGLATLAGIAAVWAALAGPARAEDILVVYHPGFPAEAHTHAEAREAFLGEGHLWNGGEVRPGVYPNNDPFQKHFVATVLGMTEEAFDTLWARRIVREGRSAPKRLASPTAMLHYVAVTPGAVGYVRQADAGAVAAYGDRLDVMPWSAESPSGN
jgi:hypothetical protein